MLYKDRDDVFFFLSCVVRTFFQELINTRMFSHPSSVLHKFIFSFFFLIKKKQQTFFVFLNDLFIVHLTVSGLSCGVWEDPLLRCTGSSLPHWLLFSYCVLLSCPAACGILALLSGAETRPSASEGVFITSGPPGKSRSICSFKRIFQKDALLFQFHVFLTYLRIDRIWKYID